MILFLTNQPLWLSALILVGLTTVLAAIGPALVRRSVTLEKLATNNEIAGFKFATVGVLYAVLLAFVIIVVWQKYSDAETTVAQEAGAAATIYRLSHGLDEEPANTLQSALSNYLVTAITSDWRAMDLGAVNETRPGRQALDTVYTVLLASNSGRRDPVLVPEILHQLDLLTQARRARLTAASGSVPAVIWIVLFGGAVLTIVFTFFFGTKNLFAQMMMTALLSILIFSEMLVVVAIDRPFSGKIKVGPDALELVLADFRRLPGSPGPASDQR